MDKTCPDCDSQMIEMYDGPEERWWLCERIGCGKWVGVVMVDGEPRLAQSRL